MARDDLIAERTRRFKLLIAALRDEKLARVDVCNIVGCSPAGARKYLRTLEDAQIIKHDGFAPGINQASLPKLYSLIADDAHITTFLSAHVRVWDGEAKRQKPAVEIDPTRHIHLMQDDTPYHIKPVKAIPQHEPLLAALFGIKEAA